MFSLRSPFDPDVVLPERIAFISVHGCPIARLGERDTGGMNLYVLQVAKELGKKGVKVDIYTRRHDPADEVITELGEHIQVIHIVAGPYGEAKESLPHHFSEFLSNVRNHRIANKLDYDLVHSHYWLSGLIGSLLAQGWGVPHVTSFHTLAQVKQQARIGEYDPPVRIKGEGQIVKDADHIIAFSRHEQDAIVRLYDGDRSRISVIPCGVDVELFRPNLRKDAKNILGLQGKQVVLFVGRLEPLKAVDVLLKSVALLEQGEKIQVVIVGGDPSETLELERIKALARDLNMIDSVSFKGSVEHRELPIYYNAADVFVLPSYYESFGLVALESMACGTPVIAARVGGLQDVVTDGITGYLISKHQPESYAERLRVLLNNEGLRSTMGAVASETAQSQTWGFVSSQILKAYERVNQQQESVVPKA